MQCEACKKNEATVHLTQIVDNKMQTFDLCESCSKTKGIEDPTGFSLASLLMDLDANKEKGADPASSEAETKCPKCGFSLPDFKKAGRFGCAQCYVAFREPLQALLKTMHKGTKHAGKTPQSAARSANSSENISQLQSQLDLAIKAENFEQAAILRDQIRQIRLATGSA